MDSGILHVLSLSLSSYWNHPFLSPNSSQIHQSGLLSQLAQWRQFLIFQMGKLSRNYFSKVRDWITQPRVARASPTPQLAPQSPHKASLFPPLEPLIISLSVMLAEKNSKEIQKLSSRSIMNPCSPARNKINDNTLIMVQAGTPMVVPIVHFLLKKKTFSATFPVPVSIKINVPGTGPLRSLFPGRDHWGHPLFSPKQSHL